MRYIGPFEILERVGTIAYLLALPSSLSGVYKVFHVSMLRKYTPDPTHVVDWGEITVDTYETFKEGPMRILDSWDKVFQCKTVRLVKSVVITPRSGGSNVGTRGHDAGHLSFPI